MNTLATYLSKLNHSDFDPGGRLIPAVTPFDGGIGEFVDFGEDLIVDLYPNKLVRCRVQRRKTWQDGRLVNLKPIQMLVEDCKTTYGDYVNGYWAIPTVFTLSEPVFHTLDVLRHGPLSLHGFSDEWFAASVRRVFSFTEFQHEKRCIACWARIWLPKMRDLGLVSYNNQWRLTPKAEKILEPLFL